MDRWHGTCRVPGQPATTWTPLRSLCRECKGLAKSLGQDSWSGFLAEIPAMRPNSKPLLEGTGVSVAAINASANGFVSDHPPNPDEITNGLQILVIRIRV